MGLKTQPKYIKVCVSLWMSLIWQHPAELAVRINERPRIRKICPQDYWVLYIHSYRALEGMNKGKFLLQMTEGIWVNACIEHAHDCCTESESVIVLEILTMSNCPPHSIPSTGGYSEIQGNPSANGRTNVYLVTWHENVRPEKAGYKTVGYWPRLVFFFFFFYVLLIIWISRTQL